ncbi:MAG: rhomboid family intramembrane serine protease [Anaerolineales bacterium]|nr:MAG: rhomboid family intramembrane serine protease [Anaerolineales bacterium]
MIPIRDDNPTHSVPIVTYLLILLNILVFVFQTLLGANNELFVYQFALIPADVTSILSLGSLFHIFTSMFMHAGLVHIGGNMLYLWIFGDNVEDRLGSGKYLIFYIIGGVVASIAHILTNPNSTIPTVGASGAIAAVLGAYLVLYPSQKVLTLIPLGFWMRMTLLPASLVLGVWFLFQFLQGLLSLGGPDVGGVAFWAHIGGFVTGIVLGQLLKKPEKDYPAYRW